MFIVGQIDIGNCPTYDCQEVCHYYSSIYFDSFGEFMSVYWTELWMLLLWLVVYLYLVWSWIENNKLFNILILALWALFALSYLWTDVFALSCSPDCDCEWIYTKRKFSRLLLWLGIWIVYLWCIYKLITLRKK